MKRHIYAVGTFAFALTMSGLPAAALAHNSGGEGDIDTQVIAQTQGTDVSVRVSEEEKSSGDPYKKEIEKQENISEMMDSDDQNDDEEVSDTQDEIEIELEDDEDMAFSLDDLNQKIKNRRQELEDEEENMMPKFKNVVKNANSVRIAVHTLLASKELLGGIGSQVSDIAREMNDSIATTTNAEAKIQSRGFFARLLFGGDSAAADMISETVARNQQHIDDLMKILGETNVSEDIQAILKEQIVAIQDAQTRLQDLAQKEQKTWGLFSWRF